MKFKTNVRINGRESIRTVWCTDGYNCFVRVKGSQVRVWVRSDGINYADYPYAW